jgi:hypothetical protein
VSLSQGDPLWTAEIEVDSGATSLEYEEQYRIWVAMSDDRDFRRNSDPIDRSPSTPCIDSDPNDAGDVEDVFFPVNPTTATRDGDLRILTFQPPGVYSMFDDPLVAVIVEVVFPGPEPEETLDDLLVTTWTEFLNEDRYSAGIGACQGKDGEDVLTINGSTGLDRQHTVVADATGPIVFSIGLPAAGGSGRFIAHLNWGTPTSDSITVLRPSLGAGCFPFLIAQGADPVAIFNSIGREEDIGSSEYFGTPIPDPAPAPTDFLDLPYGDPVCFPVGYVFTLQAVIKNPAVPVGKKVSITNAIVLKSM